eukprot:3142_1
MVLERHCVLKLCCVLSVLSGVVHSGAVPGSFASHHKPIEQHHSLMRPFDSSAVYWEMGGSAVLTDKLTRLTPSAVSRQGWILNSYPLTSDDYEIVVEFKAYSDHLGGDGFGIWILDSGMFGLNREDPLLLNGPVYGLKDTYKGFGVIFDTYDNDALRDNPSIFVLKNMEGKKTNYTTENDCMYDMLQDKVGNSPHSCTADIRNAENPVRVMIRFINKELHVYLDTQDVPTQHHPYQKGGGGGMFTEYKFCLAVNLGERFNNTGHIAITAMTGGVADIHDIFSVITRSLDDKDARIDDAEIPLQDPYRQPHNTMSWFFWAAMLVVGLGLLAETLWEIMALRSLKTDQINSVYLCNKLNRLIWPHYQVQIAMAALFLLSGNWYALILNLPLAVWRVMLIVNKRVSLEPSQLDAGAQNYTWILYGSVALYVLLDFHYLSRLSSV